MKLSVILVAVSLGCVSADCALSFRQSNRTIEACRGFSLVLECSTEGPGSTVFNGNLLNCSNTQNDIVLLHSRFNLSTGNLTVCNSGKILGYKLAVHDSGNCYTSLLCVMVSPDMAGKTTTCVHDNGETATQIGNYSITSSITDTTIPPATANALSSGEVIIYCSAISVGIVIIMTIVLLSIIFGFVFNKHQQRSVQTISSEHISTTDTKQKTSMFHCAQDDEVSGYTLCMTDYDKVDIATDDNEYNHLQHLTGQHAPGMRSRDLHVL